MPPITPTINAAIERLMASHDVAREDVEDIVANLVDLFDLNESETAAAIDALGRTTRNHPQAFTRRAPPL
jgi:hypothetical protein